MSESKGNAFGAIETFGLVWELSGPGIDGAAHFSCDRGDVLRARVARMDEFPCGIDLIFVDGFGHIAAIPRSSACREVESWDM